MKRLLRLVLSRLKRWARERRRIRHFKGPDFYSSETDPAPAIRALRLVIVGSPTHPKWLRFSCPCACGEEIVLNLMQAYYPRWTICRHSDRTVTVNPSVSTTTCGSHFWLRRNRVAWVDDMRSTSSSRAADRAERVTATSAAGPENPGEVL